MFNLKIKPKVDIQKLIKEKEIDVICVDADANYTKQLSDDVTVEANIKADLNYQKGNLGLDNITSAKVSFTKKF